MLRKFLSFFALGFLLVGCTAPSVPNNQTTSTTTNTQTTQSMANMHMDHGTEQMDMMGSMERLNTSPRHQEWVEVKNGDKTIHAWVVYPEVSDKRPVVLLIHENMGLNDWARSMADEVAEAGYIAVAPDLLSDFSSTEKKTSDFASGDAARTALTSLDSKQVTSDLKAVAEWTKTIPASNGKLAVAGFCWGGGQSFQLATVGGMDVAMVFYGTGPTDATAYQTISAPVYGFYGGADARIDATIPDTEKSMKDAGKTFEYKIYEGAGHAFMRSGEDLNGDPANIAARNAAWERMKAILSTL